MIDGDKRCGCTERHLTFGACLRNKGIQLGDVKGSAVVKRWDANQDAYASARRQGIQPSSPLRADVDRAIRISQADGEAFSGA